MLHRTVLPRDTDDVLATLAACRRHGGPVLPRGGGILELDPAARRARVQPGTICDDLRDAAEQHELTFGPIPPRTSTARSAE